MNLTFRMARVELNSSILFLWYEFKVGSTTCKQGMESCCLVDGGLNVFPFCHYCDITSELRFFTL